MTIHDELVLELIKRDKWGKPTGYIIQIVGSRNIKIRLEDLFYWRGHEQQMLGTYVEMTPDIVVTNLNSGKVTAIELETDIEWDFANSLRQIKKYRKNSKDFQDVVVIIPRKYERFGIVYKEEGFRVYFWEATRIWKCRCKKIIEDTRTIKPRCSSCRSTELEFNGIKDVKFEPFE